MAQISNVSFSRTITTKVVNVSFGALMAKSFSFRRGFIVVLGILELLEQVHPLVCTHSWRPIKSKVDPSLLKSGLGDARSASRH